MTSPEKFDVAVIGAGISGLVAARELIKTGRTVVVLEARDRVGGRLLSHQVEDTSVRLDLGATWFWPNEPNVIALISDLGVEVFSQHVDGDAMYHQPGDSKRMAGNQLDVPSGRFVFGADSLPAGVAATLPSGVVRLAQVVQTIDARPDHVSAHTNNATFVADHLVLAIPPALAVQHIAFQPALPEQVADVAARTPVWMGAITKVVARYESAFWRDNGLAGAAISHYGPMREIHDMSGPDGKPAALFGFAQPADGDIVTKTQVVTQLAEIFGPIAGAPSEVVIHDWRTEQFTSPSNVTQLGAYETFGHELFSQPLFDGRVHWSSTETTRQNPGHIEGAIIAAKRAVQNILSTHPASAN